MKALVPTLLIALLTGALAACHRPEASAVPAAPHFHQDVPPHGGTPVALGDDYNLELVRDAATGTLSAYVLDDEMEEFIRVPDPAITLVAQVGGQDRPLVLTAIANPATGETVGDTSLFQGSADWLKTTGAFAGTLQRLTIRGTVFRDVRFAFPAPVPQG